MNENYNQGAGSDSEIDSGLSKVAVTKTQNILVIILLIVGSVIFIYFMLFRDEEVDNEDKKGKQEAQNASLIDAQEIIENEDDKTENSDIEIEKFPTPPIEIPVQKVITEKPALPPVSSPALPPVPPVPQNNATSNISSGSGSNSNRLTNPLVIFGNNDEEEDEDPLQAPPVNNAPNNNAQQQVDNKKSVSSLVASGGGGASAVSLFSSAQDLEEDIQLSSIGATATRLKDMYHMVAQGKMIEAVLETAINTQLSGQLRAVVTKNIYSEKGRNILIPRGSRLIGSYSSDVQRYQTRLEVTWQRLLRPDGIDIQIASPGTDRLGRSGIAGNIDNRYAELFGNALLLSSVTSGVALIAEQFTDGDGITTTETDGGNTETSGSLGDIAVADAVDRIGDVSSDLIDSSVDTDPIFTVDQGMVIKVYVNQDLYFGQIY